MNIHFSGRENGIRVGTGTSHYDYRKPLYDYLPILRNANMYRVDLPSLFLASRVWWVCPRKSVDYLKLSVDYR